MKNLIILLTVLALTFVANAQEGVVTKIIDSKTVELNLGKNQGIKVGDIFKVYGKGQFLHPATGRMVEADNIVIGEVEIVEVTNSSSKAKVNSATQSIAINARIEKKAAEVQTTTVETKTQTYYQPEYESSYTKTSQEKEKKVKEPKGPFGWSLYLTTSLNYPIGKFGATVDDFVDFSDGNVDMYTFNSFNLGYMFYLKSIDVGEGKKVGIDISSGIAIKLYNEVEIDDGYYYSDLFYIPVRFGPVFSINPTKNLVIDTKLSFQFNLGYISTGYSDYNWDNYGDWDSNSIFYRTSLGIFARYKKFMFGIDLTGGKVNGYYYDDWDSGGTESRKTTTLGLTIGVAF